MKTDDSETCPDFAIGRPTNNEFDPGLDVGSIGGNREPVASASGVDLPQVKTMQAAMTYNVIQFFGDTEIVEAENGSGEYPTFESAKTAAIDYLQEVIDLCEMRMDEITDYYNHDDYFSTESPESTFPHACDVESNVRYVCDGCYQPDPELCSKPLQWFVGRVVKLRFPIPGHPNNGEHMWVAVGSHQGDELVGTLINEPLYAEQHYGQEIVFRREGIMALGENDEK